MKEKLIDLFEYNDYFNKELIKATQENEKQLSERAIQVMSHILNSHIFWNNRLIGQPDVDRWIVHPTDELLSINEKNHQLTFEILENRDLKEIIPFKNSKGGISTATIEDIYFHLANHGTYHRGQLATLFRQSGVEPVRTDYIFYKIMNQ